MKNDKVLLRAIIERCDNIEECINFFGNDEEDFLSNKIFQQSCAFDILQIGEAVKSLSFELINNHRDVDWKGIAGYRDIIAHVYEKVQMHDQWITITEEIPELKEACKRILDEMDQK